MHRLPPRAHIVVITGASFTAQVPKMGGSYRSGQVNLLSVFRLPYFAQESPLRRAREWPPLAENWWPHDGRELTQAKSRSTTKTSNKPTLDRAVGLSDLSGGG